MNDWRQKIFDELDYLEEKGKTLKNREELKQRLLEREESVRELFQTFHICIGKSREAYEKKIATQANRRVGGDRAPTVQDICDAA